MSMSHCNLRLMTTVLAVCGPMFLGGGQAFAQDAVLEEIVVTAQKREESLQDTPVTVSAFTAGAIAAKGILPSKRNESIPPSTHPHINPHSHWHYKHATPIRSATTTKKPARRRFNPPSPKAPRTCPLSPIQKRLDHRCYRFAQVLRTRCRPPPPRMTAGRWVRERKHLDRPSGHLHDLRNAALGR